MMKKTPQNDTTKPGDDKGAAAAAAVPATEAGHAAGQDGTHAGGVPAKEDPDGQDDDTFDGEELDLDEDDEDEDDEGDEEDESDERPAPAGPLRCGFVALIGAPNAGKSTLLNALVGAKVSIVSRKVQTTRALVRGIALDGAAQIIFVDTPGIFRPKRRLDRAMVTSAWGGAGDADFVALLVDARKGVDEETAAIIARMGELKQKKILILTKVDVVDRPRLLKLASDLNEKHAFVETFMVAALTGDGIDHVRSKLAAMMPEGPWLYPEDQVSDAPLRAMAAEITREKIFERLHDELPYQMTVETDQWITKKDGSARVEQTIFVTRDSHRMIVLGKGGQTIKAIGQAARKDIEEAADGKIHLFLFVKVRENWIDDPARYREMGLEFPQD
jgi:GTPase